MIRAVGQRPILGNLPYRHSRLRGKDGCYTPKLSPKTRIPLILDYISPNRYNYAQRPPGQ